MGLLGFMAFKGYVDGTCVLFLLLRPAGDSKKSETTRARRDSTNKKNRGPTWILKKRMLLQVLLGSHPKPKPQNPKPQSPKTLTLSTPPHPPQTFRFGFRVWGLGFRAHLPSAEALNPEPRKCCAYKAGGGGGPVLPSPSRSLRV